MDESSFMIRDMIVKSGVEIAHTTVVVRASPLLFTKTGGRHALS